MKQYINTLAIIILISASSFAQSLWKVDPVHSKVTFTIEHLMISHVEGEFKSFNGTVKSSTSESVGGVVDFSADVNSISTNVEMRDHHLKTDDFFNAEKYPQMTFHSVAWKEVGKNHYTLTGDLTIRDKTHRVDFDVVYGGTVVDNFGNTKSGFTATTKINRFDYGLKWNSLTNAGGIIVGKEAAIVLYLEFAPAK
ncbi:MAG: YceI family protein [Ignavibacteriaceae bacterium]|nr:YceI family protein [Ignavibacteriaceae bacterium]